MKWWIEIHFGDLRMIFTQAKVQVKLHLDLVGLTHQHKNREVLVEGPEITIRPVGTRRVGGDAR